MEKITTPPPLGILVLKYRFLENQALTFIRQGDYKKARLLLNEIYEFSSKNKDLIGVLEALHDLGIIFREQGLFSKAEDYFKRAEALAQQLKDTRRLGMIYGDIGQLYLQKGEIEHALAFLRKSVKIFEQIYNQEEIVLRLCQLAEAEDLSGNLEEAISNLDKAAKIANKNMSVEELAWIKFYLAAIEYRSGRFELARLFFKEIQSSARLYNIALLSINCELFLAALEIMSFLEDEDFKRLDTVQEYLQFVIQLSNQQGLLFYSIHGHLLNAILQTCKEDFEEAMKEIQIAEKLALETDNQLAYEKILQLSASIRFAKELAKISPTNKRLLPAQVFLRESSVSFLNQIILFTKADKKERRQVNFELAFFLQTERGPELAYTSDLNEHFMGKDELFKSGIVLTTILGQGSNYYEGFFGPIPLNKNCEGLVYSILLPDSHAPDPRFQGENFCLLLLIFPNKQKMLLKHRDSIQTVLEDEFQKCTDVQTLTTEWLASLKEKLIQKLVGKR